MLTWSFFGNQKSDTHSNGRFLNSKIWPVGVQKMCTFFKSIFEIGLKKLTRAFQKWTNVPVQGIWHRWSNFLSWHLNRTWPKDLNLQKMYMSTGRFLCPCPLLKKVNMSAKFLKILSSSWKITKKLSLPLMKHFHKWRSTWFSRILVENVNDFEIRSDLLAWIRYGA